MGHKNKQSLYSQVCERLEADFTPGRSKHQDKRDGDTGNRIYSYATLESYKKHAAYFVKYCRTEHRARTLEDCRPFINEWIQTRLDLSAYTVKLEAAALAKLYHCSTTEFIKTPARRRSDIVRSRGPAVRDRHFSEERHRDIVEFCKSTGLRRKELSMLTGDKLIIENGQCFILVNRGSKGGLVRKAPVIGNVQNVIECMRRAGSGRVWKKVPSAMDVHSYRAEYATAIYKQHERTLTECLRNAFFNPESGEWERSGLYRFRKDRKGEVLDKAAMLEASRALGHNRISVVAEHYIRF